MSTTTIIKTPIVIPSSFGSGGSKLVPNNGEPSLVNILLSLQAATIALDAAVGASDSSNLASTSAGEGASLIGIQDAAGVYVSTTVEGALAEVKALTPVKLSVTITQAADLAGVAVTHLDKNIGAALPANARIVGVTAESETDFDDATHATWNLTVGTAAGGAQVGATLNVSAGQTGFPKAFSWGTFGGPMVPAGGAQLSARIASTVNMSTATVGAVTINVFYIIEA
jgi:hypothetical protein